MKIIILLAALFPVFIFGQRYIYGVECVLRSLKTTCINNERLISEIKFPNSDDALVIQKPVALYGRFEDLERIRLPRFFEANTIDFKCEEKVQFETSYEGNFYYAQKKEDNRKLYFINDGLNTIYRGTEKIESFSPDTFSPDTKNKYLSFYRSDKENDPDYEVRYYFRDKNGDLVYSFHQRGNEFDEYTYEYTEHNYDRVLSSVYKNDILFEEYEYFDNDESYKQVISQYSVNESYRLDKKRHPVLKSSSFSDPQKACRCHEGSMTVIEFWNKNKCTRQMDDIILE